MLVIPAKAGRSTAELVIQPSAATIPRKRDHPSHEVVCRLLRIG